MPLRHHAAPRTTVTTTHRHHGGLFSRARPTHHTTHTTRRAHHNHHNHHVAPVAHPHHHHHQKRHVTLGDKVSGALLKLKGTLTHRPGQKAAGTRRMHGTDGRGSRRTSRFTSRRKYRY